jgi:hypothetical protein
VKIVKKHPKYRLRFKIDAKHCASAKRKDPCQCVIAQAMYDTFGDNIATVQVLHTKTILIFTNGTVKEYRTPRDLRDGLKAFDETGVWNLPEGDHFLLPIRRGKTAEYEKTRAQNRRTSGDLNMEKRAPARKKKKPIVLNPRLITIRKMKVGRAK